MRKRYNAGVEHPHATGLKMPLERQVWLLSMEFKSEVASSENRKTGRLYGQIEEPKEGGPGPSPTEQQEKGNAQQHR